MKSMGEILAGTPQPAKPSTPTAAAPEDRPHLVTLAYTVFAEIEVIATTVEAAFKFAELGAKDAKRTYTTAAVATRAHVRMPVDPREPAKGTLWVELVRQDIDPNNADKGHVWVPRRDR